MDSLPFFVALIDAAGNIQLKNQHFRYLLQKESTSYLDAFASIELVEILSSCFSRKESYQGFLYLKQQDKYLSIELEYLPFRNYFLLLIRDVSEEKKKEMFQRTFLNDISHELKTPLTNIKGYLIAMEDSKEEEKQNFLDIVLQNVQKMENTLHDFFKLSKIENTSSSEKQTFSMQELEEELHFLLQKLLQEKHGDFSITVEQNISFFLEKEELITILKNLLENAILYNTNPSPVITLRIFTSTEHYIFEVIDNGSGIPLIEQERIFNRFYRIEKSRNRNSGGTGLGLSIVKTLTQKLQGDIFIKESSSQGTTFCLLLPKER